MALLVSSSKDNLIKFRDPRTGTALTTLYVSRALPSMHGTCADMIHLAINIRKYHTSPPHGNLLGSAARDQTVRVFDIRFMKGGLSSVDTKKKFAVCLSFLCLPRPDVVTHK
jgi:polyadenylation factor subunit 2